MNTAMAGSLESMDCLVVVSESERGSGVSLSLEGANVARFYSSMEAIVHKVIDSNPTGSRDLDIRVQDHGALDIVLEARVETAIARLRGES